MRPVQRKECDLLESGMAGKEVVYEACAKFLRDFSDTALYGKRHDLLTYRTCIVEAPFDAFQCWQFDGQTCHKLRRDVEHVGRKYQMLQRCLVAQSLHKIRLLWILALSIGILRTYEILDGSPGSL